VNGRDVRHATHQEAIKYLTAPGNEVIVAVRHDPPPPGLQVVVDCNTFVHETGFCSNWVTRNASHYAHYFLRMMCAGSVLDFLMFIQLIGYQQTVEGLSQRP
jgi:hypothetical protein